MEVPVESNCSSISPCTRIFVGGSEFPLLIQFGTTTLKYAMLPYGSPSGFPELSVKFKSNAPDGVPVLTTLYQPVAVMSAPAIPTGISISFTTTVTTP